jgi:hypothetical protein
MANLVMKLYFQLHIIRIVGELTCHDYKYYGDVGCF